MATINVEYLVVGGGGAGGMYVSTNANGGGGAGGLLYAATVALTTGSYTVTVGAGGASTANGNGNKGSSSAFNLSIADGGGGGGSSSAAYSAAAMNGGSGGGYAYPNGGGGTGGTATQTSMAGAIGYGNPGGTTGVAWSGAGGGGAGTAGVNGSASSPGGNGGQGKAYSISGTSSYYAGGGGGGANSSERAGDGYHGGGRGAGTTSYYSYAVYTAEVNATTLGSGIPTAIVNTGGGGGGGSYWAPNGGWSGNSGAGGSGVVIIRYLTADAGAASGGTVTKSGLYTIRTFTTSGTLTLNPYIAGMPISSADPIVTNSSMVNGFSAAGHVLSCSTGTWTGDATIVYTYQWMRNSVNISGATSSTYTLQNQDLAQTLSCQVTATNSVSTNNVNSNSLYILITGVKVVVSTDDGFVSAQVAPTIITADTSIAESNTVSVNVTMFKVVGDDYTDLARSVVGVVATTYGYTDGNVITVGTAVTTNKQQWY